MGSCCCSARKPHFHGTPLYYYCPTRLEVQDSLTSGDGTASSFTARLLVSLDLETSIPDTYRPPPTPLPYDVDLGCQPSRNPEPGLETIGGVSLQSLMACDEIEELDAKSKANSLLSPTKLEQSKSNEPSVLQIDEEDVCPICLEEYSVENPKNLTKCEHHFHLSCILEWMERRDSCPICDQGTHEMPLLLSVHHASRLRKLSPALSGPKPCNIIWSLLVCFEFQFLFFS